MLESGTRPPGTGLFPADHTHDQSRRLRVETAERGSSVPHPSVRGKMNRFKAGRERAAGLREGARYF